MKTLITEYRLYGELDEEKISGICGAILDKKVGRFADLTYEEDIPIGLIPAQPIIKMSKRNHVEAFFNRGLLQLGNFEHYRKSNKNGVRDETEGSFVLVGRSLRKTGFTQVCGGSNFHVFCAFIGEADQTCMEEFGYDAYFEIVDIVGFQRAISKKIESMNAKFSRCIYSRDKALVGKVSDGFNFMSISAKQLEFVNSAKYFLKPDKYSYQNEFRFIWKVNEDLSSPTIIECPEAIKYCRKPISETDVGGNGICRASS